MTLLTRIPPVWRLGAALAAGAIVLAGCGSASPAASAPTPASGSSAVVTDTPNATGGVAAGGKSAAGAVLPVSVNPITNSSTVKALKIDSVLVENNVDPVSGKAADDHLEIALSNMGGAALSGFEIYYTFTDPTTKMSESYYAKLPDTFTIPAGGKRIAHFDGVAAPDHFPVNKFSLYHTSQNALGVEVIVSAAQSAVQSVTITKDAGGAEAAD